jgi:hypothetical protein
MSEASFNRPTRWSLIAEAMPNRGLIKRLIHFLLWWPAQLFIVSATAIGALVLVNPPPAGMLALLALPLLYVLLMAVPVGLAEVLAGRLRKRWDGKPPQKAMVIWGAAVLPLIAAASYFGFMGVPILVFSPSREVFSAIPWVGLLALVPAGAITAWVLWRHWISKGIQAQLDHLQALNALAEKERSLAQAQLTVLQAQIEPHFLYNTLANVQYLVRKDAQGADYMLGQLIRYLRLAMPTLRSEQSTLGAEMDLADAYLQMARIRTGGRIESSIRMSVELRDVGFPPALLLTLVENAIKHGVEPKPGPGRVDVEARVDGDALVVEVRDNGVGLGGAATAGTGVGLRNIRERLATLYPSRARLSVRGLRPQGVVASITIEEFSNGPGLTAEAPTTR